MLLIQAVNSTFFYSLTVYIDTKKKLKQYKVP